MCLFQVEGHAFPVLSKSYCLGCSRNCSSWPSLCRARSYRLPYRKDKEAYTRRWRGQLLWHFGRDHNLAVTDMTLSDRLNGNVSVTYVTLFSWRKEWRCHLPSPQSLYHSWAARSPARLLWENMNKCGAPTASYTRAAGCGSQMRNTACQCPLAHLVTLEVEWSLWRDRNSSITDVTSPFSPTGNKGYIRNRDVLFSFLFIRGFWKSITGPKKLLNGTTVSNIDNKSAYYPDFWRSRWHWR